jgi:hypothetical protein
MQKYDFDIISVTFITKKLISMEPKFKITIPKPCHEDWNNMTPDETGRFCSVCTKGVVDFSNKTLEEIQNYLFQNQQQKICGRFRNDQINTFDIKVPKSILLQKRSFHNAFLLALFIVMGTTLFSCKNHNDATLGEVSVVEDTIQTNHTKGLILPPKDTIQNQENSTVGEIDMERYDSFVKAGVKMPPLPPPPPKGEQIKFIKPRKTYKTKTSQLTVGDISIEVVKPEEIPSNIIDSTKTETN